MPQITLEYTSNIKEPMGASQLFLGMHEIAHQVTGVYLKNIKSRAVKRDCYYIADGEPNNAFIHVQLSLVEGRPLSMKQELGKQLLQYLEDYFQESREKLNLQITLKVDDIAKDTYFKYPAGSLTPQGASK